MSNGKFRSKKISFAQVSTAALRDPNLSLKAKGLYSLIQAYISIPNFVLYKNFLMKQCIEKESAFGTTWRELKARGYLVQYRLQNENGTFYYEYDLLDIVPSEESSKESSNDIAPKATKKNKGIPKMTEQEASESLETLFAQSSPSDTSSGASNIEDMHFRIVEETLNKILEQVCMEEIKSLHYLHAPLVEELEMIIFDMLNSEYIVVGNERKPRALVTKMLLSLKNEHIEKVLASFLEVSKTTKIGNVKSYLQSMLFNAPLTTNCELTSQVLHYDF